MRHAGNGCQERKHVSNPDAASAAPVTYRRGTLVYTKAGLITLFAWLLWGNFCFELMETVVPSILPLKLDELQSPKWVVGLIMTTLPGIFNTTVAPWVSFKSDRYRSRWGRRIPFILLTMPFLAMSLILIGFSDNIGSWVHHAFFAGGTIHQASVIIILLAVFAGCFGFFNMFVSSVYYYLINDVVPSDHLGRLMGWLRAVGMISGGLYSCFIFKYALTHMREIYLGAALLYTVGYGLVCLRIKEPEYPPPDDLPAKPSLMSDIRTFARECYTSRFYWDLFLYTTFDAVSSIIARSFLTLFLLRSMLLSTEQVGWLNAITQWVMAGMMLLVGTLVDRWNPVRVSAYGAVIAAFLAFNDWIWVFAEPPSANFFFYAMLAILPFSMIIRALINTAFVPREMMLFPREQYGQFCGAQALIRSAFTMVAGVLAGLFLDVMQRMTACDNQHVYRFMFIWIGVFSVVAMIFNYRGYRVWKLLGGEKGYQPPRGNCRLKDLPPRPEGSGVRHGPLILYGIGALGTLAISVAYIVAYWQAGNSHSATLFGIQIALQAALLTGYVAFVRFMERP